MNLLRIAFASLLLVVAFAAFFPQVAVTEIGDFFGMHTIAFSIDDTATDILSVIGAVSFFAAIAIYVKAFM